MIRARQTLKKVISPNKHNTLASHAERGFSLLEILIAMAILSFSLVALFGHQGVIIQSIDYSNRVSQAIFLLEGKLLDVKHKILNESVDIYDNCEDGDFKSEGFRGRGVQEYRWKVCAFKLELQEGAANQLTERLSAMLAGAGEGGGLGALGGLGAGAGLDQEAMANGMARAQQQLQAAGQVIPLFLQNLEDKIRKVRIEVSWRDQTQTRKVLIERFVTSLGSDSSGGEPPPEDSLANENKNQMEDQMINQGMEALNK
jgi:prepilin-type N-terminal cleavage/methylation domain-containing protein